MAQLDLETATREELLQELANMGKAMQDMFKDEQRKKVENYKQLNKFAKKGGTLFTGSSLMEQFPVNEYAMGAGITDVIYNRGIGGTTTDDFIREIDTVLLDLEPSKIFINIGTNDIRPRDDGEYWQEHLLKNYEYILTQIKEKLPNAIVYMMAYYPVNPDLENMAQWMKQAVATRTNEALIDTNAKVEALAKKFGYNYIDVNDGIKDEKGRLRADITVEGMHMYAGGYESVFEGIKKYL